jgi:hypothetical protein
MSRSQVLSVVVFCLLAVSATAAADTTGSVTLGGTVTSSLQITSVATAGASTLSLSGGQKIVKIADLTTSTNNEQGLTLTATSGDLAKSGGTSISFQVTSVADAASAPASGAFLIASGSDYTVGTSGSGSVSKDLYIMYTPLTLQDPGDYEGSVELTVTDN